MEARLQWISTNTNDLSHTDTFYRNSKSANPPRFKLGSYSIRKQIQLAIIEADVLLKRLKLGIIHRTDHNMNSLQQGLFLLSMAVDSRFQK